MLSISHFCHSVKVQKTDNVHNIIPLKKAFDGIPLIVTVHDVMFTYLLAFHHCQSYTLWL